MSHLLLRKPLFQVAYAVTERLHSLPFILLLRPGKVWMCMCTHGIVCFRYNVCVDRRSALFSLLAFSRTVTHTLSVPAPWPGLYPPPELTAFYFSPVDMASVSATAQAAPVSSAHLQRGIVKMVSFKNVRDGAI